MSGLHVDIIGHRSGPLVHEVCAASLHFEDCVVGGIKLDASVDIPSDEWMLGMNQEPIISAHHCRRILLADFIESVMSNRIFEVVTPECSLLAIIRNIEADFREPDLIRRFVLVYSAERRSIGAADYLAATFNEFTACGLVRMIFVRRLGL